MSRTNHQEYSFPFLVPADLLETENQLVALLKAARDAGIDPAALRLGEEAAGFENEVYWVRHGGNNKLEVPMFLRPTSETPMYTMFSLWIRSHADLPLKTFHHHHHNNSRAAVVASMPVGGASSSSSSSLGGNQSSSSTVPDDDEEEEEEEEPEKVTGRKRKTRGAAGGRRSTRRK